MEPMKIFLSSTCYDLKQIRSDLFDFITNMGFTPILSEYPNFPIDPDKNAIDNCIENVKNNTDVFILVIGNMYGSQIKGGKSITNTEYQYAKSLGIPTYIFIYKPLLNILPVWEQNKNGDYSKFVDSPKIFEFVQQIRDTEKKWCFDFEKGQDIISTLKIQLSHLFKETLKLQRQFNSGLPLFYNKLTPKAINILLKKEENYEALFFAQSLEDELLKHEDLKYDLDYQIRFGSKEKINDVAELLQWISRNLNSLGNYIQSSEGLMNKAFQKFYGEPGVPSDLKGLYYVSCGLSRLFYEMLNWYNSIISTAVEDDFITLRDNFALYTVNSALKIWEFPSLIKFEIARCLDLIHSGKKGPMNINIVLKLDVDSEAKDNFQIEMERIRNKYI